MVKKKKDKPQREVTKRQLSRWQQQKKRQRIILGSGIFIILAVLTIVAAGVYRHWYIPEYKPLRQTVITVNNVDFDMNYYIKMLKYYGQGMPIQSMYDLADEVATTIERNELIRQGALKLGISVSNAEVDQKLRSYAPRLSRDYRDVVRAQMLIDKLKDEYFEPKVPLFAEHRHILAMFLESDRQATEVRARLEAGEDFTKLASQLSLDSLSQTKDGNLGWRPKGALTTLLDTSIPDDFAFTSEVGVLSQPIYDEAKTKSLGYWIIKVLERKQMPMQAKVRVILLGSEEEALQVRARLEAGEDFATLAQELSQHAMSKKAGGDLGWLTPNMMSPTVNEFVFNTELELSQPLRDELAITRGGYWLVKVIGIEDNRRIEKNDRELLKTKALNEWVSALRNDPKTEIKSYLDDNKKWWAIQRATKS